MSDFRDSSGGNHGNGPNTEQAGTDSQASSSQASSNVKTTGSTFVAGGNGPSLPAVSVPSGGGTLRTMNEAFNFDLCTGTASLTYQVPVTAMEGRWGTPNLELTYSSGGGSTSYGIGWALAGHPAASISRSTRLGLPTYGDQDIFEYLGDELVPALASQTKLPRSYNGYRIEQYKKRIDNQLERIERWTNTTNPADVHWRVYDGDNTTQLFGYDSTSRTASASGDKIYAWHYCEGYDAYGNAQLVKYKAEDSALIDLSVANERNRTAASRKTQIYLKRILYGNKVPNRTDDWSIVLPSDLPEDSWLFELVLDYGDHDKSNPKPNDSAAWPVRKDATSSYQSGFEVRNYRLCHRFLMFHHFEAELKQPDYLVSSFELDFDEDESLTYLVSLDRIGYKANPAGNGYISKRMPSIEFAYSQAPNANDLRELSLQSFDRDSLRSLPSGVVAQLDWMDLFGDGTTGVLARNNDSWYYKRNFSTVTPNADGTVDVVVKLGDAEEISVRPNPGTANGNGQLQASFQDVEGDGSVDLVITSTTGMNGFFVGSKQVGRTSAVWQAFQSFPQWPNLNMNDPNLRQIDLTGIGRSDLLITTDEVFVWYESLGEQGYAPEQRVLLALDEERGPRVLFSDTTKSIYLADMSGDGLTDVVRILNGQVCYWPNMGHGQFGAKVTMDHAPVFDHDDSFSPQRLLLGDVDGSGTTDLLYIGPSGATLYYNQAGNSWKDAIHLPALVPRFDSVTKICAVNLLGTGMCLIWQSIDADASGSPFRSIQYLDITHGIKPHLLTWFSNNKGHETTLTYRTSTSYYLQDEQEGKPWLTTTSTPMYCIEKAVEIDYIRKTRMSQRYRYHHGYYDSIERSFCGFGMVEKWDTEEFDVLTSVAKGQDVTNVHPATFVAPTHSKTWFHVGAFKDTNALRLAYAQEFYSENQSNASTPPHTLDHKLSDNFTCAIPGHSYTDEELRQATFALKGALIREEMYSDQSTLPYTVGEYGNTVVLTQPQGDNRFVSCRTYQHESLESEFDKDIANVRTNQEITLLVDEFGNPRKLVNIFYGRGPASEQDFDEDEDHMRQQQTRVVYNESGFTNAIDEQMSYQHPQPCSGQEFELVGLQPGATGLYCYADFAGDGSFSPVLDLPNLDYLQDGVDVVQFGGGSSKSSPSRGKRLVSSSRRFYRSDDQSKRLALSELQSLSVIDQEFSLCLTPSMISIYMRDGSSLLPSDTVFTDAHYIDLDSDGSWWKPSDRLFFSKAETTTAANELATARSAFFQNRKITDVHGNSHTIDLDTYQLLPIRSTDTYGNNISSTIDYRTLLSVSITDINDNRTDYAYDAINTLVGVAVVGKGGSQSDSLTGFNPDLTQEELDKYFLLPAPQASKILGTATTCHFYSLSEYSDHRLPIYSTFIQGESYGSKRKDVQISFSYLDGSGETIQSKEKADKNRWRVSGWHVLNNKGDPVELYTPVFSDKHDFEFNAKSSSRELIFYDARSRKVATLYPNYTWDKISYSNWSTTTYSPNNLVDQRPDQDPDIGAYVRSLESNTYTPTWYESQTRQDSRAEEKGAAQKSYEQIKKSSRVYLDAHGETILQVSDTASGPVRQRMYFNSQGHQVMVRDALGRIAEQERHDMSGNVLLSANIDAGWTWTLTDATTNALYNWTSTSRFRQEYDKLNRPTQVYCKQAENAEFCISKSEYGENLDAISAKAKNLRGQPYKLYDQSGMRINQEYDVMGNCVHSDQQLAVEYKQDLDWSTSIQLEATVYSSKCTFDALGRMTLVQAPDGAQTSYVYDQGGLLNEVQGRLTADSNDEAWEPYVNSTLYDEQKRIVSQRTNQSILTRYQYDDISQKLVRKEIAQGIGCFQDIEYFYDANGNLVYQVDAMQTDVYFRNASVKAGSEYTYDNLNRLIQATGREHIGQTKGKPFSSSLGVYSPIAGQTAAAADGSAFARYTESYSFDSCGNMLQIRHEIADAQSPGWTRSLVYTEPSKIEPARFGNALSASVVGNATERFTYDVHGNTTSMANVSKASWDPYNRLKSTVTQVKKNGTPETTYYVYDITGQRIRKVVERASDQVDSNASSKSSQTYYLDNFEQIQKFDGQGSVSLECRTSKITGGSEVCTLLEQWSGRLQTSKGLPSLLTRFQYKSSTGSVVVELDDQDNILSYEEYTPYGSTTYHANITTAPKRYRYAGKERDHETGFYYNYQRYYVAWLCRWLSPDPAGSVDGFNLYAYVSGNPITYSDPTGNGKKIAAKKAKPVYSKGLRKNQAKSKQKAVILKLQNDLAKALAINEQQMAKILKQQAKIKKQKDKKKKQKEYEQLQQDSIDEKRQSIFAEGEAMTDLKQWQGAHLVQALHDKKVATPVGKQTWVEVMEQLYAGVDKKEQWAARVVRVPGMLNPGKRIIGRLDSEWTAWYGENVVDPDDNTKTVSRENAIIKIAYGGSNAAKKALRTEIKEQMKHIWRDTIPWVDIEFFSMTYKGSKTKLEGTTDYYKNYDPWNPNWVNPRNGKSGFASMEW